MHSLAHVPERSPNTRRSATTSDQDEDNGIWKPSQRHGYARERESQAARKPLSDRPTISGAPLA